MEKLVSYLGYFSISFEKSTFYTEIFDSKSWIVDFSLVSLMKKDHKTTFLSVENNYFMSETTEKNHN